MNCKICFTTLNEANHINDIIYCTYCGAYKTLLTFDSDLYKDRSSFYKVSSWIKEQNEVFKEVPLVTNEKFDELLTLKDKKLKEKFNLLIFNLFKLKGYSFNINELKVKSWIKDDTEFFLLFEKFINLNFIKGSCTRSINGGGVFTFNELTFDGLSYLEELQEPNINSKNIFVAFNFEDSLKDIFNVSLKTEIEKEGFNYVVVNQDNVDHNKSINDEIIVKLKSSRIVIADFTNHRNSVYFEAGYAMGMNIPIIWTCQAGHENDMSFDTRQFPHIVWKDEKDLVK